MRHPDAPQDFESFWTHFLGSHTSAAVRWCHVAGLACGLGGAALALRSRRLTPLLIGGGAFAALAVFSHPVFGGNWPENFGRPRWAARAFLRLSARTLSGAIHEDLAKRSKGQGPEGLS